MFLLRELKVAASSLQPCRRFQGKEVIIMLTVPSANMAISIYISGMGTWNLPYPVFISLYEDVFLSATFSPSSSPTSIFSQALTLFSLVSILIFKKICFVSWLCYKIPVSGKKHTLQITIFSLSYFVYNLSMTWAFRLGKKQPQTPNYFCCLELLRKNPF